MICDISKYQGTVDWQKLAPSLDFVVLKASGKHENGTDPYYARNVAGAVAHGIPFHVFHFLYCLTEAEARRDAALFFRSVAAEGHWPLFWVLDCEAGWGIANSKARSVAEVFEVELRRLCREQGPGEIRVAIYIGHNRYKEYALDYDRYAYVWIPRYGDNDGTIAGSIKPAHPCDLWQYTSKGKLPGINANVDLDVLMGTKPLEFFTGGSNEGGKSDMFTSAQLVEFCKQVLADQWVYWYGTYGKKCSQSLYTSKKKQYPDHYTDDRTKGYQKDIAAGRWCADCVGMIKGFFWKNGDIHAEPKYKSNNCPDKSADGMIGYCSETGPIKSMPDIPGLVVWKKGHIGVYIGGGYTIEMRGFNYDCVKRKLKDGPWTKWGRLPASMIEYSGAPAPTPEPTPEPEVLRKGDKGAAVKAMQLALLKWDAACLPKYGTDSDFGSETEKAVKAFQKAAGLPVTGVYDEATKEALTSVQPEPEPAPEPTPAPTQWVLVTGGSVNVRSAPGTTGTRVLGVVHKDNRLPYQGQDSKVDGTEWHLVEFNNKNGWISGKYSKVI